MKTKTFTNREFILYLCGYNSPYRVDYDAIIVSDIVALLWDRTVFELPDNLTIRGNLDLCGCLIEKLPKNLKVEGSLIIDATKIKELPKSLIVWQELFLCSTRVDYVFSNNALGGVIISDLQKGFSSIRMSPKEYNKTYGCRNENKCIFSPKNIMTMKKLLYIPELFQNVYYGRKSEFISLLQKI